jgi:uncharacterized protein
MYRWITEKRPLATDPFVISKTEASNSPIRLAWRRRISALARWLHIYLSMLSFAIIFFFAVTGLTLNHADKFGDRTHTDQEKGQLDQRWVKTPDTLKIAKLEIVEYLRNNHGIKAALSDFRIDNEQIGVSFKGPGFAAEIFIDRATGAYDLTKTSAGFIGIINDLHKGRDTGRPWSVVIDVAAILMTLVSLTGMILLLYIKRKRLSGLMMVVVGLAIVYIIYKTWVN